MINNLKTLSFEDKIRLLPEKEQSYLLGYVDRALSTIKSLQDEQPRKPPTNCTA